jgi:hypothetical protein
MQEVYNFLGLPMSKEQIAATLQEHHFEKMKKKRTGASQFALPDGFFRQGGKGRLANVSQPYTTSDLS